MASQPAHFTQNDDGVFMPTRLALGHLGYDHLNGPAVVGLTAQVRETHCGSLEFMPTRLTVDLFKAARSVVTKVDVRVVRDGRRVRSAECDVVQGGRTVARRRAPVATRSDGARQPRVDATTGGIICLAMPRRGVRRRRGRSTRRGTPRRVGGERHPILSQVSGFAPYARGGGGH